MKKDEKKMGLEHRKTRRREGKLKLAVVGFYCCDSSFGIGPNASFITK